MNEIEFGSACSGIEAASVAWNSLGWRAAWLAEIDPFASAVLAHHYPEVPNLGDMTALPERIASGEVPAPDVFCGGTPCQAFSVAGLRRSLDDARGNLSLTFCEIANAIDTVRVARGDAPAVIFWENVPGVLSTSDNAFGCFLAGLAGEDDPLQPPGGKWSNAGYVLGPKRALAWRLLDAQFFGLAQRRRRVFVVASSRDGFDPAAVLFEPDCVRRDTAPSREARETTAHATAPCLTSSGRGVERTGDTRGQDPVVAVCPTLRAGGNKTGGDRPPGTDVDTADSLIPVAFGGNRTSSSIDVTPALLAHPGSGYKGGFETETFLVQPGTGVKYAHYSHDYAHDRITSVDGVNPALTKEAHASGNLNIAYSTKLHNTASNQAGKVYAEYTTSLDANSPPPAVFQSIDHVETMPTMTAGGPSDTSHNQVSGQMRDQYIVPVTQFGDTAGTLTARHDSSPCADRGMNVVAVAVHHYKCMSCGESFADKYATGVGDKTPIPAECPRCGEERNIAYADQSEPIAFHPTQTPISSTDGTTHGLGCGSSRTGQASIAVAQPYTLAIRGRGDTHQLEYRRDGTANALLTPNGGRGGIGVGAVAAPVAFQPGNLKRGCGSEPNTEVFPTLAASHGRGASDQDPHVMHAMAVRRLTPVECERLQGFPDGYTRIPTWNGWRKLDPSETPEQMMAEGLEVKQNKKTGKWRVKDVDGPRYKALGNSWAIPCVAWIGRRIDAAIKGGV
jgi:DNA (cytosine-5)-methyltransferase 1